MPRRHAASGDASPASQDTINVAQPRQPRPPTRLKLKFPPKEPVSEPEESLTRPKRKISRPARYLDNVCEPLTKKRRTTTASTMSLQTLTSPPPTSEGPVGDSSDPILLTSSELVDKSDYADSNEAQHAGYGADFLNNFIDDTPRSSLSALDSVIGSEKGHKVHSEFLPESDALPEAAALVYDTFTELTSEPPVKDIQSPIVLSSSFSSLPQQLDSPEVSMKRLQNACHALAGLNIPNAPLIHHMSSTTTGPKGESKSGSLHRHVTDDAMADMDKHDSVDALLTAAAGYDQAEDKQEMVPTESYAGEPDEEVSLLINKAIEILRYHIAIVRGLSTNQERSAGQGKHSKKTDWNIDTEQLVLSSLEPLLYGGATNIGCIIPTKRANLLSQLYSQLIHFVTAPHIALSRTVQLIQHHENSLNAQQRVVAPSKKRSHGQLQKTKAVKVPVPHKFLSRQKNPMAESPLLVARSNPTPAAAPAHGYRAAPTHPRPVYVQATNGYHMPYSNLVRPQLQPVFFAPPQALFPGSHGVLLPAGVHPLNQSQPGPAVLAQHGFGHYPLPAMPMLAQPPYQPYQRMMPQPFPPDSWIPMPNFGPPPVHKSMRNPFWH
ncbi:hypothetical protein E4T50_05011 [Aureobasidium sp. EXF-12298]|nr:hypothetical protein E4T50_05011 [Aureobasidium sp. EXF-12298]KAI4762153.1 hypothetical protein E4T51_04846 [Aureobasidium sp. EXF-12344]KAI4779405.1 hypothetical protein E4T52_05671 [Aureobasidium sp. EXF-3400]